MPGNFRTEAEKIVDAQSRGERRVILPGHTRGLFWPENSIAGPSVRLGGPSTSIYYVPNFRAIPPYRCRR